MRVRPVRPYIGQRRLDGGTASSPGVDEPRSALGSVTVGTSGPGAVMITVEIQPSARATTTSAVTSRKAAGVLTNSADAHFCRLDGVPALPAKEKNFSFRGCV